MIDPPAFRRRPAERGAEILDAAITQFASRGFEKTRIVDIAREAGVSHGTVGSYYPTKEALLRACIERLAQPEMDQVDAAISGFEGTTRELLEWLGLFWGQHCKDEQVAAIIRVVEGELGNFPDLADTFRTRVYDPVIGLFVRIIARGVSRGEFTCDDPEPYAEFCFGSLTHAIDWNEGLGRVLNRPVDVERYVRIWATSAACGLRVTTGAEGKPAEWP
ncbi:TetR/AcrR family transcriptional regulator [Sphingomonas sp.]|jgi:AcrR family transcriptional regulator|uniref:TetR/AcrR family transcriptional regulator n=1 Tax=Sphingomonas sp. TaxID=28214 RepID=UPI002D7EF619|nr:TetR/AcrR family transcriptional regulator [Sphingomonas sp.]HEU0043126.1 TetR/AcrR family transcriptional regulator [Sphingomonas sp.]